MTTPTVLLPVKPFQPDLSSDVIDICSAEKDQTYDHSCSSNLQLSQKNGWTTHDLESESKHENTGSEGQDPMAEYHNACAFPRRIILWGGFDLAVYSGKDRHGAGGANFRLGDGCGDCHDAKITVGVDGSVNHPSGAITSVSALVIDSKNVDGGISSTSTNISDAGIDRNGTFGTGTSSEDHPVWKRRGFQRNMKRAVRLVTGVFHTGNLIRSSFFCVFYMSAIEENVLTAILETLCYMLFGTTVYFVSHLSLYLHYPKYLTAMEDYATKFGLLQTTAEPLKRHIRNIFKGFLLFLLIGGAAWAVFGMLNNLEFLLYPMHDLPGNWQPLAFCATVSAALLISFPVYGFFFFYSVQVSVLASEFQSTREEMAQALGDNNANTEARFDHLRERHYHLCKTVSILSKLISSYITLTVFFNMVLVCLSIYALSSTYVTWEMALSQIFNIGLCFFCLTLFSFKWCTIHREAHDIVTALYPDNWTLLPTTVLEKINLVLAFCSNTKIGVDVFGFFVVDNSTFITIFGTLLTYGVVVVQFQVTQSADQSSCLTTSNSSSLK